MLEVRYEPPYITSEERDKSSFYFLPFPKCWWVIQDEVYLESFQRQVTAEDYAGWLRFKHANSNNTRN